MLVNHYVLYNNPWMRSQRKILQMSWTIQYRVIVSLDFICQSFENHEYIYSQDIHVFFNTIAGQCRTNLWPAVPHRPWCRNAHRFYHKRMYLNVFNLQFLQTFFGLKKLTASKSADVRLTFVRHSGIYMWFSASYSKNKSAACSRLWMYSVYHFHHHPLLPEVCTVQNQNVFLSSASRMDVLGVYISTSISIDVQCVPLSTARSIDVQSVFLSATRKNRQSVCLNKCWTVRHPISPTKMQLCLLLYIIAVIFLASWKRYTIYPMTVNLHKGPTPPPPPQKNCVSDVSIF